MSSDLTRQTRNKQAQTAQATNQAQELTRAVYGARAEISKALADRIGPDRFLRALATEIRTTKHLDECTPESVLGGLFVAAQLGLEVGGARGLVYLVPYYSKELGAYEASLIVGYKGYVDLFYKAGARAVQWFLIREGDTFQIGSDSTGGKVYRWAQDDPNSMAPVTGAVAQVITGTGGVVWEYLSRADIEKRSTGTPFWRKWWDEMALKTVLRRLAATAPLSEELAVAAKADETVQRRVEVPGLPAEITGRHLPLTAGPEQRPMASPRPATPSLRPGTPPQPVPPAPPGEDAVEGPEEPAVVEEPTGGPEEDYEARERAAYEAWLADQERGR